MHKKLMLACMAIAAFAAFVIAPAASASPVLTDSKGTLAPGASITAVNVGLTKFTGSITVTCDHDHLTGTVTENSGTSIKGEIPVGSAKFNGTGTSTDCTSDFFGLSASVSVNSKLCLESIKGTDTVKTTGCEGKGVNFTLTLTGEGPCTYETAGVTGTYKTNADAEVTISEQEAKKVAGGFFCPGSGKLDMVFTLTTTDGSTISVS